MTTIVFDIETIPDIEGAKRLHHFADLNEQDIAKALFQMRRQQSHGSDFLRHHLHKIVAISIVAHSPQSIKVWSVGDENASEAELIERFFHGLEKYQPTLVSWNGSGFDLPVIHYRSLIHGISAPIYWENGDDISSFRFNHYRNRFHERHCDLMDVLSGYQARANAPLDEIACLLGFPGKMGMSGGKVWEAYQQGNLKAIRDYCETDVLNTFLVWLRFQLFRGQLTLSHYQQQCNELKTYLRAENKPHFNDFVNQWETTTTPIDVAEKKAHC